MTALKNDSVDLASVLDLLTQVKPHYGSNGDDPTLNVKELNAASVLSLTRELQSGLATADRMSEMRAEHNHIMFSLRADHNRELIDLEMRHVAELRAAESARIDAIRLVDTGNVTRAAEVSTQQASALATAVAQSAEALRAQVEATRIATRSELETALRPITTTIESLRQTQFQQQGERSAQQEGTGDDRFVKVFQQSQQQYAETMKQSRDEATAREERAAKAAAIAQAQFLETIAQSRKTTSSSRTGVIIAGIVGGSSVIIAIMTLIVLIASHVL